MSKSKRTQQEKLSLLNELIRLGDADGRMDRDEFEMIRNIANRLGAGDDELELVLSREIVFTPPREEMDRILWLQAICMVLIADHEIHAAEVAFVLRIGLRLGFDHGHVAEMLRRLKRDPTSPLSPEELIPIFQVRHN